ncbi:EamA family transporter [Mycolicibacterium arseniciresistens]|uniref:EamA family transporter n=1 Tax=Mycolicibacterium arseniciresistens TaxID=3062257 RepID=A0ABT8U985_9MYCO|nr:EamA family transporter [Mycolicibacterium arseniciresistens]MDO3634357.1 EamA family transporter [Mycolicibacterium arseniciresistens]
MPWVPLLFVVGAVSQYLGAAIGVFLFDTTEPSTVAWLRVATAAALLCAWRRPWRLPWTRRGLAAAGCFGLITAGMNLAIYEAIARIPLGTAVAIEFLGPVLVAALGFRHRRDVFAVVLVCAGVILLAGVQFDASWLGVAFALASAAMWAGYIVMGKIVADAGQGLDSLAVGMAIAAVVIAPAIIAGQAWADASVFLDARTWLVGAGIGVLSTAIPYVLDQLVLARVGRARFALLLSLLPTTAAVVGAVVLLQIPTAAEIIGIVLVIAALVVGARPTAAGPPA